MCNRVSTTDAYVYLKVKIPRDRYESLVRAFGNSEGLALRHLRLRWEHSYGPGPLDAHDPSSAASGLNRVL